jgi:serine/threonine protein kinase
MDLRPFLITTSPARPKGPDQRLIRGFWQLENVLLNHQGLYKLIDFGSAVEGQYGHPPGMHTYMPEHTPPRARARVLVACVVGCALALDILSWRAQALCP